MSREVGLWQRWGIEKVAGIERRVAMELEQGAVVAIGARARDRIEDAARGSSELRRVRIRQHLEFEDGLDAEQHAGRGSRRLVVDVADVGAVEEETVHLRARAVDR